MGLEWRCRLVWVGAGVSGWGWSVGWSGGVGWSEWGKAG